MATVTALVATPLAVVAGENLRGAEGWLPGLPPVIAQGLIPFGILTAAVVGFRWITKKFFGAMREDADQAVFVLLLVGFAVLTATAVWFRGEGMALGWPW